jgi:hypothetical protein
MYRAAAPAHLDHMRLYADFTLLNGGAGPSGVAHKLLTEAGYRPEVVYVPAAAKQELPTLVLDSGDVIATVPAILAWLVGG